MPTGQARSTTRLSVSLAIAPRDKPKNEIAAKRRIGAAQQIAIPSAPLNHPFPCIEQPADRFLLCAPAPLGFPAGDSSVSKKIGSDIKSPFWSMSHLPIMSFIFSRISLFIIPPPPRIMPRPPIIPAIAALISILMPSTSSPTRPSCRVAFPWLLLQEYKKPEPSVHSWKKPPHTKASGFRSNPC